jgi:hypothetical protein
MVESVRVSAAHSDRATDDLWPSDLSASSGERSPTNRELFSLTGRFVAQKVELSSSLVNRELVCPSAGNRKTWTWAEFLNQSSHNYRLSKWKCECLTMFATLNNSMSGRNSKSKIVTGSVIYKSFWFIFLRLKVDAGRADNSRNCDCILQGDVTSSGSGACDIHNSASRDSWMKKVRLLNSSINTRHQPWKQNVEFFVWLSCEIVVWLWQTISGEWPLSSEKVALVGWLFLWTRDSCRSFIQFQFNRFTIVERDAIIGDGAYFKEMWFIESRSQGSVDHLKRDE